METRLHITPASDFTLSNGFKIIFAPDTSNQIVSIQLYIRIGSTNESDNTRGYSHLLEHLTFKSTSLYPANTISDVVPGLGGVINAYTEFDTTCYYLMLPAEHLAKGLEILSEIAFNSDFSIHDIKVEKDIIIEEIKQYDYDPESEFIEWIQNTYFKENPLKYPILGTKESIKKASLIDCRNFYKKYYNPHNCFLSLSGCFDIELVKPIIEKMFGKIVTTSDINFNAATNIKPEKNGFKLLYNKKHSEDDYLAFVLPELVESDDHSDAMLLLMKIFAAEKHSRLYKRLVEKDKIALAVKLHSISGRYPGITVIQIIPLSNAVIADIIYAFYDELFKIKQNLPSDDEIDLIKREMHYSWLIDFEYVESIASSLASEEVIGSYQDLYSFPQRINAISKQIMAESLNKYWLADYMAMYFQGQKALPITLQNNIIKLFKTELPILCLPHEAEEVSIDFQDKMPVFKPSPNKSSCRSAAEFEQCMLDNGMLLITRKVLNKPAISVSITAPISQLNEDIKHRGINYFTSVLMLYGSQKRSYDEIHNESLKLGYSVKVNHTIETTTLRGKCFRFNLDPMLSTLSELLQYPLFPARHLSIIKSGTIDNIRREKSSPFSCAYNKWMNLFLGSVTNLNKSHGNISQTKLVNVDAIADWYHKHYSLSDFTISAVGDIDSHKMFDLCNELFNINHPVRNKPEEYYLYTLNDKHLKVVKTNSDQANIIIGGCGCPAGDIISNTAFYVLSQILGGDLSSRFFNILREKYGYAYQTGFDFTSVKNFGYWFAYAICDKGDNHRVLSLLQEILEDIRINGVTQDELETAKNYLLGLHRFDMESLGWQSNSLSILYSLGYEYDYFLDREARIKAVDMQIIRSVAQEWLKRDDMYVYFEE